MLEDKKKFPPAFPTKPSSGTKSTGTQRVRVSASSLHGQGVFAVMLIPPRTFIGEYIGEVLSAPPRDCRFVLRVTVDDVMGQYHFIDARDPNKSNFTRFLNDPGPGQPPNCQFVQSDAVRADDSAAEPAATAAS